METTNDEDTYTPQEKYILPLIDDFHVHLRQDGLMKAVTPLIRNGGCCDRVFVMPNTNPPITTCNDALNYKKKLEKIEPNVDFRMSLYLHPNITIFDLQQNAKICGVTGIKYYPKGVTTNSEAGVESLEEYYPLFREMERLNITLHIHGETPNCSPLLAEEDFLPRFEKIANHFSDLKIVLEHCSTKAAVSTVQRLGSNVGGTITAHHLYLTSDDVLAKNNNFQNTNKIIIDNPYNYCKPLIKTNEDREALREIVSTKRNKKFFFGSDSAPHPVEAKNTTSPAAGIFTQPLLLSYLSHLFYELNAMKYLKQFVCENGASFFGIHPKELIEGNDCALIFKENTKVPSFYDIPDDKTFVVPFLFEKNLNFKTIIKTYNSDFFSTFQKL